MKVAQINSVCGIGSTGRICAETARLLKARGDECRIFFGREKMGKGSEEFARKFGNRATNVLHYFTRILFDDDGKGSYFQTRKLLRELKKFQPDVVHVHNLHGHYIHYKQLMDFLAENNIPTVFSLYDCWNFTGNCTHFDYIGCEKWKIQCENCPHQSKYPMDRFWLDCSARNYQKKRAAMARIRNKCIAPGSYWMESLVRQSFLKDSQICTVQSGIDLTRFQPVQTDLKERYGVQDKHIVLFVAGQWTKMKGSEYLPKLIEKLPDSYQAVVIGNLKDKNLVLPERTIYIPHTNSMEEMVAWYSAADVYVNLTLQETLGLTNIEALACGTPVVTFDSGGCAECVNEKCGIVVPRSDLDGVFAAVQEIVEHRQISVEECLKKSRQFHISNYRKYLELYDRMCQQG